jgi:alpha-L-rhamnosidase
MSTSTTKEETVPQPIDVRFEHHDHDPAGAAAGAAIRLGIGESRPRLSWRLAPDESESRGTAAEQLAYRVQGLVDDQEAVIVEVDGADQVLVPWPFAELGSRQRAEVRIAVRDRAGWSPWSAPAAVETGLLDASDWVADFVGPGWPEERGTDRRPARVRRAFALGGEVASARVYVTAHGLVELEVNGARVGDEALTPGWTSYAHRLRYATFDVTEHLRAGDNVIGAWLGDGWWRGRIGFEGGIRDFFGDDLGALVQLEATLVSGERVVVASDGSWSAAPSPILFSGLYDGERVDATLDDPGWSTPGASDDGWSPVAVVPRGATPLVAPTGPPVRAVEELAPVSVEKRGDGRYLLDFGQNHSGRLRIRVSGDRGTTVTLRHAEVLQGGDLYTRTLRRAEATDVYTLAGSGDGRAEEWEPRFTIHGYRYAEVSGWPGELGPGDVVSRVHHSDMRRTGWFRASDPALERLHENVLWSLRSNFVDLPTDCPQRDERLGWTGDIQVFTATAAFLYDVTGMLSSWLRDVDVEQQQYGRVPFYVPYLPLGSWKEQPDGPSAVWDDVAVLTPDVLHERSGDRGLLERQYASGVRLIEQYEQVGGSDHRLDDTFQLGDWLDPNAPPEDPFLALTDRTLVATAYFAHSARRLGSVARTLGRADDAAQWSALGDDVARVFAERWVSAEGRIPDDSQTAYSLAIVFDLLPSGAARTGAGERLAQLVRDAGGRIATGFAGTNLVSDALTRTGHLAEAYSMLATDADPSWLYPVSMDATTIWERWDSMLPNGTVNPGEMTSFNHYALGAVADWMHRVVAGLAPASPGYRSIRFAPRPAGTLTSAGATHLTPYGETSIDWSLSADGRLSGAVTVPPGATGILALDGADDVELGPGTHPFSL